MESYDKITLSLSLNLKHRLTTFFFIIFQKKLRKVAKDNGNILADQFDDEGDNDVERIAKEFEKKYVSSLTLKHISTSYNYFFLNIISGKHK